MIKHIDKQIVILFCLMLLFNLMAVGQITTKTENFTYTINGSSFNGSFQYQLFTRGGRDILGSKTANIPDFNIQSQREIVLKIINLKVDNQHSKKFKLRLEKEWLQLSNVIIPDNSDANRKVIRLKENEPLTLKFVASGLGPAALAFGYAYDKTPNSNTKINFNFTVKSDASEPAADEVAWKKISKQATIPKLEQFITKHPKSKYVAEAKKRIAELEPKPEPKETAIGGNTNTPNYNNGTATNNGSTTNDYNNSGGNTANTNNGQSTDNKIEEPKEQSEEEKAWAAIRNSTNKADFEAFAIKFPNSVHTKEALNRLNRFDSIRVTIDQQDNEYTITLKNANQPTIKDILPKGSRSNLIVDDSQADKIVIIVKDKQRYTIQIEDSWGKSVDVIIDPSVAKLDGEITVTKKNILYNAIGGAPPYSLEIKDANDMVVTRVALTEDEGTLKIADLGDNLNGQYNIYLLDNRKTVSKDLGAHELKQTAKKQFKIGLFAGLAVGIGILAYVLWYFYNKLYRQDDEEEFLEEGEEKEELTEETVDSEFADFSDNGLEEESLEGDFIDFSDDDDDDD